MQIIPLSEGRFTIDGSKEFIPFNPDTDDLTLRPRGSLLVEIQPFVLITSHDIILLDTGLGFKNASGELQIHENLRKAGISAGQVTKVFLSHLHKDHAGGLFFDGKPAFINAVYYINKKEWEYALEKGRPSFDISFFSELSGLNQVRWLEEKGIIEPGIEYEVSGGHSPYHMVFRIADDSETIFYGGDVAPQWKQMVTRYITKYDSEPRRSMELRQQWWKEGQEKKWKFLFYHDISHPVVAL